MVSLNELIKLLTDIDSEEDMERLFHEIFTDKERNDIALRWQLMKELHEGQTQRSIAARHNISLCKITRGSKILKNETSLIRQLLIDKFGKQKSGKPK